jgi:cytoskeleton protein RodZ
MSDSTPDEVIAPTKELGPGAMIRAAREKQGLHIAALAAAIKVAPRKLDALENDRWDELPDATFTRALAQTVCRTLKIDAGPVLEKLPALGSATLKNRDALNEPFRERSAREEPSAAGVAIRPMVWAAGLLMLAALALYLAPKNWWQSPAPAPAVVAPLPKVVAPAATVPALPAVALQASEAALAGVASNAANAANGGAASAASSVAAAASAGAAPAATETVFSAPPPGLPASANAATALAGVLNVRTSEPAWVEVRDAGGQTLLRSFVSPSESVNVDGALPLRVVVGNASAVQLLFKGQAVDLASRAKGNVARFDLP